MMESVLNIYIPLAGGTDFESGNLFRGTTQMDAPDIRAMQIL